MNFVGFNAVVIVKAVVITINLGGDSTRVIQLDSSCWVVGDLGINQGGWAIFRGPYSVAVTRAESVAAPCLLVKFL
jgi:hypothetical protein